MRKYKRFSFFIILAASGLMAILLFSFSACTPTPSSTPEEQEPTDEWTVMIYMCGSDLESRLGAASKNLNEIKSTGQTEKVNILIQTGGAKKWRTDGIDAAATDRYLLTGNELELLSRSSVRQNFGEPETLSDFLKYGLANYPAKKNMLIMWNHGGGSLKGVCFDENYSYDGLTLAEISQAFIDADISKKLDIVGFDACVMATVDTALTLSPFADYMLASEEIEPSGGWNYTGLLDILKTQPATEAQPLGTAVCNSYFAKSTANNKNNFVTLSLVNLAETDAVISAFNALSEDITAALSGRLGASTVISAAKSSEKYGGSSAIEGYSNLLDLTDFALALSQSYASAANLEAALSKAVVYSIYGQSRSDSKGLSFYYPQNYQSDELKDYTEICQIEGYKKYLQTLYTDIPAQTVEFVNSGSAASDGSFEIEITQSSVKYVASVDFLLLEMDTDGETMTIEGLGQDNDIKSSQNYTRFNSNFRGIWLSLDGHKLSFMPIDNTESYILFTAPILLNGIQTNLRFSFIWDDSYSGGGYYTLLGTWGGLDENGISDKNLVPLKPGDEVIVLYNKISVGSYSRSLEKGDTFIIGDHGGTVAEMPLEKTYYQYVYKITDIFGNIFYSYTTIFKMKYTYEELLKNPLPDGEYAADIDVISQDVDNQTAYGN